MDSITSVEPAMTSLTGGAEPSPGDARRGFSARTADPAGRPTSAHSLSQIARCARARPRQIGGEHTFIHLATPTKLQPTTVRHQAQHVDTTGQAHDGKNRADQQDSAPPSGELPLRAQEPPRVDAKKRSPRGNAPGAPSVAEREPARIQKGSRGRHGHVHPEKRSIRTNARLKPIAGGSR